MLPGEKAGLDVFMSTKELAARTETLCGTRQRIGRYSIGMWLQLGVTSLSPASL